MVEKIFFQNTYNNFFHIYMNFFPSFPLLKIKEKEKKKKKCYI